jgi:hypothetical protein
MKLVCPSVRLFVCSDLVSVFFEGLSALRQLLEVLILLLLLLLLHLRLVVLHSKEPIFFNRLFFLLSSYLVPLTSYLFRFHLPSPPPKRLPSVTTKASPFLHYPSLLPSFTHYPSQSSSHTGYCALLSPLPPLPLCPSAPLSLSLCIPRPESPPSRNA